MSEDEGSDGFTDLDALFGEARVNHGGPGAAPVVWKVDGFEPVTLQVSNVTNTGLMAQFVWQSSMTLSQLLAQRALVQQEVEIGPNSTVIELGSGAALPSIVCDKYLHAACVVATDYPDDNVLLAMTENAKRNACSSNLQVLGLDWEEDAASTRERVAKAVKRDFVDYILAADTLWMPQYHTAHLRTVRALLGPNTRLVMAFMHHDYDGKVASGFITELLRDGSIQLVSHTEHNWRDARSRTREDYGDVQVYVFKRAL